VIYYTLVTLVRLFSRYVVRVGIVRRWVAALLILATAAGCGTEPIAPSSNKPVPKKVDDPTQPKVTETTSVEKRAVADTTNKSDAPKKIAMSGLVPLDLSSSGVCLTISTDPGAVVEPHGRRALVSNGDGFRLAIGEFNETLHRLWTHQKSRAKEFTDSIDTDNLVVFGLKVFGMDDYHCYVRVEVEGRTYLCHSEKAGVSRPFTHPEAMHMADCAKTLFRTNANQEAESRMQKAIDAFKKVGCRFKPAVNHLEIEGDDVTDVDLAMMKDIPQTHCVIVSAPNITNIGLAHLRELPHLDWVSFAEPDANDDWLAIIPQLTNVIDLSLRSTSVTDQGLKTIGRCANLLRLTVKDSDITDEGLTFIGQCRKLESLCLNDNAIGDEGLKHLARVTGLTGLELKNTNVTDAGLRHLRELKSLNSLDLSETSVTDTGLHELEALKELYALNLLDTKVTRAGVEKLKSAMPKRRLMIQIDLP
jgi:hypothetical protein